MLRIPRQLLLSTVSMIFIGALSLGAMALAQDDGETVYNTNCAACHQGNGQGIPSAFPPLAQGHIPDLLATEEGRTYLIDVLLYGLQGEITVLGSTYNGQMPAWNNLSDEQIAQILTYITTAWDNEAPEDFEDFTPEEIANERGKDLTMEDVLALRQELGLGE